jgi:hypothetical protein
MGAPAARDLNWGLRRGHRESRRKTVYAVGEFSGAPPVHAADHVPHQRLQTVEHILKFGSCIYEGVRNARVAVPGSKPVCQKSRTLLVKSPFA